MKARAAEQHWTEAFAGALATREGEPAWLGAARKAALARFAELGFPDRRHEDWKYTNPAPIAKVPWRPAEAAAVSRRELLALGLPLGEGPRLVFANGRLAPDLCDADGLPAGAVFASLGQVLARDPGALEPWLARPEAWEERAFAALAAACWTDGAFARVPRDAAFERPLQVVFLAVPGAEPAAAHPRLLVVAEPGSRARVVEIHAALGTGEHLTNALGEIRVGENASLEHVKLVCRDESGTHLATLRADVERNGSFKSLAFALGARLARNDWVAALVGEGAECRLDGLYVAADGEHVDVQTTIDHQRPHGTSREHYKGVLSGHSRGVFNGRVVVRPDAQKTDARQKNDNLLLSGKAEVNSKPQLEIHADDVRCSHGSTIGQLDEDALFYLRSRGLGADEARAMLMRGFVSQITAALGDGALRDGVEALALERSFGGAS